MTENNKAEKITPKEMFAALATAGSNISEYLHSNKHFATQKETEKPYWLDCQVNQAVKFRFKDNKVFCQYTVEILNPLRLGYKHEANVDNAFSDIVQYLKKGYKEITGKSLGLKQATDIMESVVQSSARRQIRTYVAGYVIEGVDSQVEQDEKDTRELLKKAIDKANDMTVYKRKK